MDFQDFLHRFSNRSASHQRFFPFALHTEVLEYICNTIGAGSNTLETGSGLSTVLFASRGSHHICIDPNREVLENIKAYCRECGVSVQGVTFYGERSENILPSLELNSLDLVLIDGHHAFPIPFIDWFYAARALKVGGVLIIDDINIWTGNVLKEFLLLESEWNIVKEVPRQAIIFRKEKEGGFSKQHYRQPFVMLKSDIKAR
ncbi:MAG: class I SAM-dependent methyltransferase, partial [Candidatus Omnitrophica bacterium]|nr:class I SAM-dependent methyltransferase [Candidatus Omnitrophota bacterium]